MTGAPGTIRVLVADDQRVVRDGLAMLVGLIDGAEVVAAAGDGAEAVRLLEAGQLDRYKVPAPSHPMAVGSRILGFTLLGIGLLLLLLVAIGFFANVE